MMKSQPKFEPCDKYERLLEQKVKKFFCGQLRDSCFSRSGKARYGQKRILPAHGSASAAQSLQRWTEETCILNSLTMGKRCW